MEAHNEEVGPVDIIVIGYPAGSPMTGEAADILVGLVDAGIDVIDDGEMGKSAWITYLYERVSGLEQRMVPLDGGSILPPSRDRQAFPGTYAQHDKEMMRAFAENEVRRPPRASGCATARSSTTGMDHSVRARRRSVLRPLANKPEALIQNAAERMA